MGLFDNLKNLVLLSLTSTGFFTGLLISYAFFYDYILIELYDLAVYLQSSSLLSLNSVITVESIINWFTFIPALLDKLWFFAFLFFVIELARATYRTKREGYFSTLGMLTYGTIILMFISGLLGNIAVWYKDMMYSIIPTLSVVAPLFNFYISNLGLIHLSLSVGLILLNFIDLKKLKAKVIPKQITQSGLPPEI